MTDESSRRTPLFYHEGFAGYDFGANHPFRGDRFKRFISELETRFPSVFQSLDIRHPEPAPIELLEKAHTRAYIERVHLLEKRRGFLSVDTQILPGSIDAARLIVGGTVAAAKAAIEEGIALGFGGLHHAGPDYGEGFCIFNDIAVAAKVLLDEGLERVMLIDTDAHQGNGTMDIFYNDPRVLFVSIHQDPATIYPGRGFVGEIGSGDGAGFTVNIPMPMLAGGRLYHRAMEEIVFPLLDAFNPQIIIRYGGSDPLYTDTLTNLGLEMDQLTELTGSIATLARERRTPLADLFLSGYGPYVLEGWLAIIKGTLGVEMELREPEEKRYLADEKMKELEERLDETLERLKYVLEPYWKIF
ncbi:hypothetical protein DRQ05_04330 [bacterium]|nr:MAG: hypothetical protein DRQ05_04330 [bacterium]